MKQFHKDGRGSPAGAEPGNDASAVAADHPTPDLRSNPPPLKRRVGSGGGCWASRTSSIMSMPCCVTPSRDLCAELEARLPRIPFDSDF